MLHHVLKIGRSCVTVYDQQQSGFSRQEVVYRDVNVLTITKTKKKKKIASTHLQFKNL